MSKGYVVIEIPHQKAPEVWGGVLDEVLTIIDSSFDDFYVSTIDEALEALKFDNHVSFIIPQNEIRNFVYTGHQQDAVKNRLSEYLGKC